MTDTSERYTDDAERVLFFARYEASELGSTAIQTEHVLIGLIREGHRGRPSVTTANRILALSGLTSEQILKQIEKRTAIGPKVATIIEIPFSDQTKRVLESAAQEAEQLGHQHICPEHLLLGLLRDDQSIPSLILSVGRLNLSTAREQVANAR